MYYSHSKTKEELQFGLSFATERPRTTKKKKRVEEETTKFDGNLLIKDQTQRLRTGGKIRQRNKKADKRRRKEK